MRNFSSFTLGLAFFSMFFGSGNLVFPLFLGASASSNWPYVAAGFILGGVLGPFLGTMTMVLYKGDTDQFFRTLSPKVALIFMTILTAVWIPLGAGPRCIQVAYEAFLFFIPSCPFWAFSVCYSLLVVVIILRLTRIIETLGYVLTPLMLVLLAILCIVGTYGTSAPVAQGNLGSDIFYDGLIYGYSTMDLIASFFFSSSLIYILKHIEPDQKKAIRKAFYAGIIGMSVLALVYFGLIILAARNAELLKNIPKEQVLPFISTNLLGKYLSIIPVVAIILACMTTSIAMTSVYAEFIGEKFLKEKDPPTLVSSSVSALLSMGMSFLGLNAVIAITWPILQISCPLLIILAIYNVIRYRKTLFKS